MSPFTVNVVVTCTNRKSGESHPDTQLRFRREKELPKRLKLWTQGLTDHSTKGIPAIDLYGGNYWSVIREMARSRTAFSHVRFWVISAGFGLIPVDRVICSYAATFSSNKPDSVLPDKPCRFTHEDWWIGLGEWHKQQGNPISSLTDLAKAYPSEPLIVGLSPEYLTAVYRDLYTAREFLHTPKHLVIISSGSRKKGPLRNNFLPCDARMEHVVGVSRMALNARIIRHVLSTSSLDQLNSVDLEKKYSALLHDLPSANYPVRDSSTDEEVARFIRQSLGNGLPPSSGKLLRLYRDTGKACEQSRFRQLLLKTQQNTDTTNNKKGLVIQQ